jgi:hypothetical protein
MPAIRATFSCHDLMCAPSRPLADTLRHKSKTTCFARARDQFGRVAQEPQRFVADVAEGTNCDFNWYEGNDGELGGKDHRAKFSNKLAPALLGFDESIDGCPFSVGTVEP